MPDDWLAILLAGELEVPLPELAIAAGEIGDLGGQGQLTWRAGSPVRVQATTEGAEAFRQNLGLVLGPALVPAGTVLRADGYAPLTGRTQDGWVVATDPRPLDGYQIHNAPSPHVLWDFTTSGVCLNRDAGATPSRVIRALLSPPPPVWLRMSERTVSNECFPEHSHTRDWLVAATGFGRVAARRRADPWFEVRLETTIPAPTESAFELMIAVADAFAFLGGRECSVRGYEDVRPDGVTRRLDADAPPPAVNPLCPPLGNGGAAFVTGAERLLGLATDFFLTDIGGQVSDYLALCWDTADNALQTRLSTAGIALEGLLRLVGGLRAGGGVAADVIAGRRAVEGWLAGRPADVTDGFERRLRGFLGSMQDAGPADIMREWELRGYLGVTREDREAWQRTRHPGAHGHLIDPSEGPDEFQRRMDRYFRVVNTINKVVLQLMGYTGQYHNYGRRGWVAADFPAAPCDSW